MDLDSNKGDEDKDFDTNKADEERDPIKNKQTKSVSKVPDYESGMLKVRTLVQCVVINEVGRTPFTVETLIGL